MLSDLRIYEDQHVFGGAGALSVPGTATHILVSDPYSPVLSDNLIFIICVFLFNELEFYNMSYNSNTIGINCVGITNPRQQHLISPKFGKFLGFFTEKA